MEAKQQETALQIIKAGSNIGTAERLAEARTARDENGKLVYRRYGNGILEHRLSWLGSQFLGLAAIAHISVDSLAIKLDVVNLDNEIMDNPELRELTLIEMQEAFRKGVMKEYGDYFGLSSVSLLGFLKGFLKSEKKQAASAIIYRRRKQLEQEANERFLLELHRAEKEGKITLPTEIVKTV